MLEKLKPLLPGEDLFGLIGRSHVLGIGKSLKESCTLLGIKAARLEPGIYDSLDFEVAAKQLGGSLSSIRAEHTCQEMMRYCMSEKPLRVLFEKQKREGIDRKCDVYTHPWRWCLHCANEDMEKYGITYYRRDHQVVGVYQCSKHNANLISHCSNCGFSATSLSLQPIPPIDLSCVSCGEKYQTPETLLTDKMKSIQKYCLSMVNGDFQQGYAEIVKCSNQYIYCLSEYYCGLSYEAVVSEFYRRLNGFYSIEELNEYCIAKVKKGGNYCSLLRGSRLYDTTARIKPKHPLAYAMLKVFLDDQDLIKRCAA
jgi:hypothetical protein